MFLVGYKTRRNEVIFCVLGRYIWEAENPGGKMLSSVYKHFLSMWGKLPSLGKADLTTEQGRGDETADGGIEATHGLFPWKCTY